MKTIRLILSVLFLSSLTGFAQSPRFMTSRHVKDAFILAEQAVSVPILVDNLDYVGVFSTMNLWGIHVLDRKATEVEHGIIQRTRKLLLVSGQGGWKVCVFPKVKELGNYIC